jgi:hypothetical protein
LARRLIQDSDQNKTELFLSREAPFLLLNSLTGSKNSQTSPIKNCPLNADSFLKEEKFFYLEAINLQLV